MYDTPLFLADTISQYISLVISHCFSLTTSHCFSPIISRNLSLVKKTPCSSRSISHKTLPRLLLLSHTIPQFYHLTLSPNLPFTTSHNRSLSLSLDQPHLSSPVFHFTVHKSPCSPIKSLLSITQSNALFCIYFNYVEPPPFTTTTLVFPLGPLGPLPPYAQLLPSSPRELQNS